LIQCYFDISLYNTITAICLIQSAGAPKEEKKKGKKGKQQGRSQSGQGQKSQGQKSQGQWPLRKLTVDDIKEESPTITEGMIEGTKIYMSDLNVSRLPLTSQNLKNVHPDANFNHLQKDIK
jgi:hypothetical protein